MRSHLQLLLMYNKKDVERLNYDDQIKCLLLTFIFAFWNLIGPHANTCFTIVCQTGWALIAASFTIPAIPESVTLGFIGEDAIQSGTVCCWNSWLCWFIHLSFITINYNVGWSGHDTKLYINAAQKETNKQKCWRKYMRRKSKEKGNKEKY